MNKYVEQIYDVNFLNNNTSKIINEIGIKAVEEFARDLVAFLQNYRKSKGE